MIEVRTVDQLNVAIRKLRTGHARGLGTMDLIKLLEIDPLTQLRGADWRGTDFADCDLRGVDLSDCRLAFCDFTNADVAGAVFHGSDLYRSTLHRAQNVVLAYLSPDQLSYLEFSRSVEENEDTEAARVFKINQKISAATSFDKAKRQFYSISAAGLHPDRYSAGLLAARAKSAADGWEALQIIGEAQCVVNEVFFTTVASRMRLASNVRKVMDAMRAEGIAPGVRIYNTLLSRMKTSEERLSVLGEMDAVGIAWDNVTYGILMRRVGFLERKSLLMRLINSKLRPNTAELNILLQAASSEDDSDDVLEIANEFGIRRDAETYALLATHKARPAAFRALSDDMIEDGINRDALFYSSAIKAAKGFSEACFLLGRMKSDGLEPDAAIFDSLAKLAALPRKNHYGRASGLARESIAALIRRVGTREDIAAARLDDDSDQ
jgi:hypothetical protein